MSELAKLQQQIKETNDLIKALALDIEAIKNQLMYATKKPVAKGTASQTLGVEEIRMMFTKELEDLLKFTDKETYVDVRPIKYLGSDNFAKVAAVIREAGGEYISQGKQSHFKIPKKA